MEILNEVECVLALLGPLQGLNAVGQLGDGSTSNRLLPTVVHFDGWWSAAAAGDYHSCGIRADGSLWCWVRGVRRWQRSASGRIFGLNLGASLRLLFTKTGPSLAADDIYVCISPGNALCRV